MILSDDGLATGSTMRAALWAVARERPARAIVAVPVGAPDTVARIAVGRFCRSFDQAEDAEVAECLGRKPPRP